MHVQAEGVSLVASIQVRFDLGHMPAAEGVAHGVLEWLVEDGVGNLAEACAAICMDSDL